MAHHNHTPESVLNAPERNMVQLIAHYGASRAERRHPDQMTTYRQTLLRKSPELWRLPNTPYVKPSRD